MNDTTWVKLYRKSLANDVRRHDPTAWRLFETLLLLVDSRTGKWSGGRYQLVEADGSLNGSTIYKALQRLEAKGMVSVKSNTRYSEISICKWSHYTKVGNTSGNNEVTTNEQPSNTLTRSKEVRSKNIDTNVSISITEKPVDDMFKLWNSMASKKLKPTAASKRACSKLLKEYGEEAVIRAVHGAIFYQQKDYRPQVLSFTSMVTKWDSLNHWMAKDKNKANLKVGFVS